MGLMALVQRWDEARLLWEAKGYSIDEVSAVVQAQVAEGKRPQLANLELSESTVARRTRSNRAVPKGLDELVEELSTKPGRERETEVVEAGLRVLRGKPPRSKNEPQEIAQALLAIFPTNELGSWLTSTRRSSRASWPGASRTRSPRRSRKLCSPSSPRTISP
jgi:hypothetical protein